MHNTAINEFIVHSDFPLPVAGSISPTVSQRPEVSVRRGKAARSECLMRAWRNQFSYDVGDGILVLPRDIEMFVDNAGGTIIVDTQDEHLPMAGLWVIHLGLALCTLFQGGLPLHGAGLEINGHYFAIMARSGAGKSTLTAAMIQNGARFGNDDLVPVRFTGSGPMAWPSFSLSPKVHRTALERFGINWQPLPLVPGNEPEHYLALEPEQRIPAAAPLRAVFILQPVVSAAGVIAARRLEGADASNGIAQNMHGVWAAGSHIDNKLLGPVYGRLTDGVPVYTLRYTRSFEILSPLIETISCILADSTFCERQFTTDVC